MTIIPLDGGEGMGSSSPKSEDTQPGSADNVADLQAENAALTKALTGLTCGGSEFFIRKGDRYIADITACVAWVRRARDDAHKNLVRVYAERNALRRQAADADTLAVLLDNVVIAQSLSRELRERAHDEARSYLYNRRQQAAVSADTQVGEDDAGDDELIERSLRTVRAYDAVRLLRDALHATSIRVTGYDWNADPDGLTKQQGDALALADKVFADLNAAVAKTDEAFEDFDAEVSA